MPLSTLFIKNGIGPNAVTILGFIFFVAGCYLLTSDIMPVAWVGFALLHLGVMLDYADGIVARSTNSTSFFGGWLDNSIDRLADFIIMIPIAIGILDSYTSVWVTVLVLANIFMVCFFHYIHDIGYFYRSAAKDTTPVQSASRVGSRFLHSVVSGWLRVFNRDTIVFILSVSLLVKVLFAPFVFVFIVVVINVLLHGTKEVYRKE